MIPRISLRRSAAIITVLSFVLSFPSQPESATAEPTARELCTRLWTEYTDTCKGGDWDKVASWFAEDAVLIYPGITELRGQDAIRAHFRAFQGVKFLSMAFSLTHFAVAGDEALTFAELTESYQQGTGPVTIERARCGVVWQHQANGAWRISHFLVNHVTP